MLSLRIAPACGGLNYPGFQPVLLQRLRAPETIAVECFDSYAHPPSALSGALEAIAH